jgi:N-acetylglucosamine-6-phosphate deacetylase
LEFRLRLRLSAFNEASLMKQTLTARRLITHEASVDFPVVEIAADGTIAAISTDPKALSHETATLTAAFFDIHTHGVRNHDVMSATPAGLSDMQRFLASHGLAHYLPTTVTAPIDATLRALESLANAIEAAPQPGEAQPAGIHLEGPFLSHAKRGVHSPEMLQPPSIELFDRFQAAARGHIKLVTIAPEPNAVPTHPSSAALELIRHATASGVSVSVGHSNATAAETLAAIDAGAASATHTFNAMRPLDQREPGILGIVLDDNRLFAELICDGVHVAPPLVRLWLRSKSPARAILVSDSISATGMKDGDYMLGGLHVTVANGVAQLAEDLAKGKHTLAGSVLTLDSAVANLQTFTKASLAEATHLASHNPAEMLGMQALIRIAPGSAANLNRFDADNNLVATYIRGQAVSNP